MGVIQCSCLFFVQLVNLVCVLHRFVLQFCIWNVYARKTTLLERICWKWKNKNKRKWSGFCYGGVSQCWLSADQKLINIRYANTLCLFVYNGCSAGCFYAIAGCILIAFREKTAEVHMGTTRHCQPSYALCVMAYVLSIISVSSCLLMKLLYSRTCLSFRCTWLIQCLEMADRKMHV